MFGREEIFRLEHDRQRHWLGRPLSI